MCVSVCTWVLVPAKTRGPGLPRPAIIGSFELSNLGAGNWTRPSGRSACSLNHWTISITPIIFFLMEKETSLAWRYSLTGHSRGRGRQISVLSGSSWCKWLVSGEPGLSSETLSWRCWLEVASAPSPQALLLPIASEHLMCSQHDKHLWAQMGPLTK